MAKSGNSRIIIIAVVVLVVGLGGWYFWQQSADKPAEYATTTVARSDLTQSVTATGTLQAVVTVDVSSQISGNIAKLYVDWNSPVKAGQLLAEIDPSSYQNALKQSEGQLANAQANQALMQANAERSRELFKQKLIAQSDLDTAEAQLAQAAAQVTIQEANHETAKVNLARCTIYSPIDGIVISRSIDVGNTVAVSLSAPTLFQIANDLKSMQIDAAVSEADIGSVEVGQTVTFTVDAFPNHQFRGTVSQIRLAPKTQQNVVIYDTMIDVRNDDLKLKPGMTANASIIVARRTNVLKVANSALRARLPDGLLPVAAPVAAPATTPDKGNTTAATPALRAATDEERRQLFADAGFVRGNGPPSPEVRAKMEQLAKDRGLELPERAGRGNRATDSNAPVTRTLYLLAGTDPKTAHPVPVTVKLGITDGMATEIVDGLKEGDLVITSVTIPGAKPATGAPSTNPFGGGGRRGF